MIFDNVRLQMGFMVEADNIEAETYEEAQQIAKRNFLEMLSEKPEVMQKFAEQMRNELEAKDVSRPV